MSLFGGIDIVLKNKKPLEEGEDEKATAVEEPKPKDLLQLSSLPHVVKSMFHL